MIALRHPRPARALVTLGVLLTAAVGGLSACATPDEPYAYLQPRSSSASTNPNLWPLRIDFVDGERTTSNRVQVAPGTRKIRGISLQGDGLMTPRYKTVELEVEPCKTYELGAEHSSRMNPEWELRVVKVREERQCAKQFLSGGSTD